MDSRNVVRRSEFDAYLVTAICYNFRKRCQARIQRRRRERVETWGRSLIRNRNKMRSILVKPVQQNLRDSAWQHWVTANLDRLRQLMDPYHRWYRKECRILEKVNGMRFEQDLCHLHGSAWAYVVAQQRVKLIQNRFSKRLKFPSRGTGWNEGMPCWKGEFERLMPVPKRKKCSWDFLWKGQNHWQKERAPIEFFMGYTVPIQD